MNDSAQFPSFLTALHVDGVWRFADRHGRRFVRFGVVGVSGVAVNTAVLWTLVTLFGLHHLIAAAISSEVSILTNFALNDLWTFGDAQAEIPYLRRAAHYNAVALSGMVISLGMLFVLTEAFNMHYLVANLISLAGATLSNYVLNMRFTWSLHVQRAPLAEPLIAD